MSRITPFLWFDGKAEEAANFYTAVFPNSRVTALHRYTDAGPAPAGTVMTVEFELDGLPFVALNGGPEHATFNLAISFSVSCETQAEIDSFWDKLSEGGKPIQCGWLTDRYGVAWQIVPKNVAKLFSGQHAEKAAAAMRAMFTMTKLDIAALEKAYDEA